MPPKLQVRDLGVAEYQATHELQLSLVEERKAGAGEDCLLLVEHPHVITLGRKRSSADNILAAGDVPIVEIERGGDVTYHGPGQLVAYPIVRLGEDERDLHRFLRALEDAIIATCTHFDIEETQRVEGATGVWKGPKKLASIGIACRRWVIFHGLALNVSTDLSYFGRLNPCGFDAGIMTSMNELAGRSLNIADIKPVLAAAIASAVGRTL